MLHGECASCHVASSSGAQYCSICHTSMCSSCAWYVYPNRFQTGICKNCLALAKTHFPCGRCMTSIAVHELEFFCELCAAPLCIHCIAISLEQGVLKCAECCDTPIRSGFAEAQIRCDIAQCVQTFSVAVAEKARRSSATVPAIRAPSPLTKALLPVVVAEAASSSTSITPASDTTAKLGQTNHTADYGCGSSNQGAVVAAPTRNHHLHGSDCKHTHNASSSTSKGGTAATETASLPIPTLSSSSSNLHPQPALASSSSAPIAAAATAPAAGLKYRTLIRKQKLGEGAQGVVYKCYTRDGDVVVSKEMIFEEGELTAFTMQLRQSERLRQLSHPHLIRYLDVYSLTRPLRVIVVMPYYVEGDLKKFITRQKKPITELCLCSIVLQIAEALNYLHQQEPPLVHYDIKPENILLLNNEEQVLLMDLDLCSSPENASYFSSTTRRRRVSTTYEYRAPEFEKTMGSPKTDVFSLGVVSYVLATLPEFPLVRTDNNEELVLSSPEWTSSALDLAIRRAMREVVGYSYSAQLTALIVRMLATDAAMRPTSGEVANKLCEIMENRLRSGEV